MARPERAALRFVRALLAGAEGRPDRADRFATAGEPPVRLPIAQVRLLASSGVLVMTDGGCRASKEAASWVRRQLLDADAHAAQHRLSSRDGAGIERNLAESPLARLAVAREGEMPFLAPHHVEAGEWVRRLVERAQLRPRTTMSYAPRTSGGATGGQPDLGDLAVDARRALDEIVRLLPRDCAGVVVDVCGLLKGLQTVEQERGWPRRSAKLVLRIGLEQVAQHRGLTEVARGRERGRQRAWHGEGALPRGWY